MPAVNTNGASCGGLAKDRGGTRPSLKALRALEAVGRLGTLGLAARELKVTAGAVGYQIKELERDLGIVVLERHGRHAHLTAHGDRLVRDLRPALDRIRGAVQRTRKNIRRRRLLVASLPLFATCWLFSRLERFKRQLPKVDIIVEDRFIDGPVADADIAIEWGTSCAIDNVTAERLTHELVLPVCSQSVCANGPLSGATLLHRHHLSDRYDFPDWESFLGAVGLAAREGIASQAGNSVGEGLIMNAARASLGVALVNATVAHDDLQSGNLVRPVDEAMEINAGYWLLIPKSVRRQTEVRAFREWLLEELASSAGGAGENGVNANRATG